MSDFLDRLPQGPPPTKGGAEAHREIRLTWKGLSDDAAVLVDGLADDESVRIAKDTVLASREIMALSRNSPCRKNMNEGLSALHAQGNAVTERLLVIQGARVMRSLIGQGRITVEGKAGTYIVE